MTTINLGKIKPLYKGTYTGGVTYRPLDFTLYLGNLYVCKASSTGNLPTDPAYFDPVVSVNAAAIPNTPAGSISATTVQAAINELDAEKVAKTDVIAVAKGGTGATTANAAADAIGAFRKGTILGTVSQSAGVPTGAVIERGSNANGEYVRFADGTQICTAAKTTAGLVITSAFAGGFRSAGQLWTYPAGFASAPRCYANPLALTCFAAQVSDPPTTADTTYIFQNVTSDSAAERIVTLYAIGRWF